MERPSQYWGTQVIDFARDVAGATEKDKCVVAGNSIGALAALYAASRAPDQTRGLCLCLLYTSPSPRD